MLDSLFQRVNIFIQYFDQFRPEWQENVGYKCWTRLSRLIDLQLSDSPKCEAKHKFFKKIFLPYRKGMRNSSEKFSRLRKCLTFD